MEKDKEETNVLTEISTESNKKQMDSVEKEENDASQIKLKEMEENENDIQTVLDQVSQSLKTINNETFLLDEKPSSRKQIIEEPLHIEGKNETKESVSEGSNNLEAQQAEKTAEVLENSGKNPEVVEFLEEMKNSTAEVESTSQVEEMDTSESDVAVLDKSLEIIESEIINKNNCTENIEVMEIVQEDEGTEINSSKENNFADSSKLTISKTIDEENDVVAIEEPATVINLDDDDDDEMVSDTTNETQPTLNKDEKMMPPVTTNEKDKKDENEDKNKETIENNCRDKPIENGNEAMQESDQSDNDMTPGELEVDTDVFNNKECINNVCEKKSNLYYTASMFALNFYRITLKPNVPQFICDDCYDLCVDKYQEWCRVLDDQQPLLLADLPDKCNEFVEILDSSDEETDTNNDNAKENAVLPAATIQLIENELDDALMNVLNRVNIQHQLTWSKSILEKRINDQQIEFDNITENISKLQRNIDKMYTSLYQNPKIEMKILPPFDLNFSKQFVLGEASQSSKHLIPPVGDIYRKKIETNGLYFAAKNKVMASWLPVKVIDVNENSLSLKEQLFKVKFIKTKVPTVKLVPAKHIAYNEAPTVQLTIGTRVIALFDAATLCKEITEIKSAFYPGIIAEALQSYNSYRYLIFFDDGYTQYVNHCDVRLICEVSANVWEDIHPGSREFIQNYLKNYQKNRPMVQVKKGQTMITELYGKWIQAKVIDIDASLINMQFEGPKNYTEWIYRGSTRLGPLFKATQNTPAITRLPRRSEPYVRYVQDDDIIMQKQMTIKEIQDSKLPTRAVAKKSTSQRPEPQPSTSSVNSSVPVKHLNNSTIFVDDEEPKGKLVYYSSKMDSNPPPKRYVPHDCGTYCNVRAMSFGHNYGVLSKPLLNGWLRSIYKMKGKKVAIVYIAPCGRRLRTMQEVHRYLRKTKSLLNVENFAFDPECDCLTEYQVQKCIVNKTDISEGKEKIPIQCVNYYDHTMPPECVYSAVRLPTEGVHINTDENYLVGCNCEDDCSNKSICSCWQLTLEGAKYGNPDRPMSKIGYYYKRLPEAVPTGIYECNSRCKCSKKCINRVVQHPLETKLQVFKTSNRGWGLRCINDVPKGAFICIYAGDLLTEQKANEGGAEHGDEYFAELDYIEVAERLKEGYESDVESEDDKYTPEPENDSDEEFRPSKSINRNSENSRYQMKRSNSGIGASDYDDEQERQAINFEPNTSLANSDEENSSKYHSTRKLFGKNEYCYIMDAKKIGNVGRYFNHSCAPNLFVQNVFVDTHDLRFPWVAFFALQHIRAGTELTWNYNYEVGVVPGKVLYCQCGAPKCRGRLL